MAAHQKRAQCKECGSEFSYLKTWHGRGREVCSDACKAVIYDRLLARLKADRDAKRQREAFKRFDKKAMSLKAMADRLRRDCAYCGAVFIPCAKQFRNGAWRTVGNPRQTMCGKGCSTSAAADAAREKIARIMSGDEQWPEARLRANLVIRERTALKRIADRKGSFRPPAKCVICEKAFRPRDNAHTCCSVECRAERNRRQNWETTRKGRVSECPNCHVQFSPLRRVGFVGSWSACSDECQEEHRINSIKKHKRAAKVRRRAQEIGVKYETFDPFDVFKRDKWKCKACGVSTPSHLRGTYDANAPELDHIVPLSRGGWHAPDNCQTLCRQCNGDKGSMLPDEWKGKAAPTLALF